MVIWIVLDSCALGKVAKLAYRVQVLCRAYSWPDQSCDILTRKRFGDPCSSMELYAYGAPASAFTHAGSSPYPPRFCKLTSLLPFALLSLPTSYLVPSSLQRGLSHPILPKLLVQYALMLNPGAAHSGLASLLLEPAQRPPVPVHTCSWQFSVAVVVGTSRDAAFG